MIITENSPKLAKVQVYFLNPVFSVSAISNTNKMNIFVCVTVYWKFSRFTIRVLWMLKIHFWAIALNINFHYLRILKLIYCTVLEYFFWKHLENLWYKNNFYKWYENNLIPFKNTKHNFSTISVPLLYHILCIFYKFLKYYHWILLIYEVTD